MLEYSNILIAVVHSRKACDQAGKFIEKADINIGCWFDASTGIFCVGAKYFGGCDAGTSNCDFREPGRGSYQL